MSLKKTILASSVLLSLSLAGSVMAQTWSVNHDQSSLGFEVEQGGAILSGQFQNWTAFIDFDPSAPESATLIAEINTNSAHTGNGQFDGMLPTDDWFDVKAFPSAEFKSDTVTLVEGSQYKADGTLNIKGITLPVSLEFELAVNGDTAHAKGTATLSRQDYGLGEAVAIDTVGQTVTVVLDLTATK